MTSSVVIETFVDIDARIVSDAASLVAVITRAVPGAGEVDAQCQLVATAVVDFAFVDVFAFDAIAEEPGSTRALARPDGVGAVGVGVTSAIVDEALVHVHAPTDSYGHAFEAALADAHPEARDVGAFGVFVTSAIVRLAFVDVDAALETDAVAKETVGTRARTTAGRVRAVGNFVATSILFRTLVNVSTSTVPDPVALVTDRT